MTYDDPQAVCNKAEYVNSNLLGGLFIWELSGDLLDTLMTPLLDSINRKLEEINFDCARLLMEEDCSLVELPPPAPKGSAQVEATGESSNVTELTSAHPQKADTVSGAVDNLVNTTSEAISGFIESTTVPDVSAFLSGTEIPSDNETALSTVTPETLPAETGSTVGVETLPGETGSIVGVETSPAETGSTVSPGSTAVATTTDEDVEDEEEANLENGADAVEGEDSAASGQLTSTVASIVSVGIIYAL